MEHRHEFIDLECLPFQVLNVIFEYLDLRSLLALSATSKALNRIVKIDYMSITSCSLLVTNQVSAEIKRKSLQILSGIHKYRNHFHWKKKHYNKVVFLKSVERFRPWLQLNSRNLFVSQGSKILLYKRNMAGVMHRPYCVFKGHRDDVVRFVVKDGVMISGGNDGKICFWETHKDKLVFFIKRPIRWNENLYTDFSQSTVAAGFSILGEVNFLSVKENGFTLCHRLVLNERLRSISLSEDASLCALGSCGYRATPLKVLDVESGIYLDMSGEFKVGAGIYDIIWETPHVLLTGGYDTVLNMWDTRYICIPADRTLPPSTFFNLTYAATEQQGTTNLGQRVRSWSDPFDVAVYTLASDYNCTIMTGSACHGRVTLWDKRHSGCVQVYFVKKTAAGPVYSLDFDPTFMFVALDKSFRVLDFSGSSCLS